MPRQTYEQKIAVATAAIRDQHAVTLSFGHRPILAEPLSIVTLNGSQCLVYLKYLQVGQPLRPETHSLKTSIRAVVDLGRSMQQLEAHEYPDPEPRGPGRPPKYDEPTTRIEVKLPTSLIEHLDAATDNRTAYIEGLLRGALSEEDGEE